MIISHKTDTGKYIDLLKRAIKWDFYQKNRQQLPQIAFFGREMVELRSPDLWGVPFDAEFYARFAHEGPEAGRTQFGR